MTIGFRGLLISAVLGLGFFASVAHGAPVPVGGSATFPSVSNGGTDFVPPTGDLLASDSRTITVTYDAPAGGFTFAEDNHTTVQFKSEVRRDPATGKLTFLYQFDEGDAARTGLEGALATYASFTGFTTDVTGDGKAAGLTVSRSIDGATLSADGGSMGIGRPPTFAVATDATKFDSNGTITLTLRDEFSFNDPNVEGGGQSVLPASGTANLDSTFQPIAQGPTPIPLPPAVWTGAATFLSSITCARLWAKLK